MLQAVLSNLCGICSLAASEKCMCRCALVASSPFKIQDAALSSACRIIFFFKGYECYYTILGFALRSHSKDDIRKLLQFVKSCRTLWCSTVNAATVSSTCIAGHLRLLGHKIHAHKHNPAVELLSIHIWDMLKNCYKWASSVLPYNGTPHYYNIEFAVCLHTQD